MRGQQVSNCPIFCPCQTFLVTISQLPLPAAAPDSLFLSSVLTLSPMSNAGSNLGWLGLVTKP